MRKFKYFKALAVAVLSLLILQAGIIGYAMIQNKGNFEPALTTAFKKVSGAVGAAGADSAINASGTKGNNSETTASNNSGSSTAGMAEITGIAEAEEAMEITIPEDILELIRQSNPAGYERDIENYKEFLSRLKVHEKYKNEIENMIREGLKLPDIMIAYSYINDKYGNLDEVKAMVSAGAAGKDWRRLFEEYSQNNPEFIPRSFDSSYLEKLLKIDWITKDDIMIADRVSQKLSVTFDEIIQKRIGKISWLEINAGYNIINGQEELPYVPVKPEKVKKLSLKSGLSENSVVQAFVMAYKLGLNAEEIISKVKAGHSKERIFADCLKQKYD
jgi:hypothetical protein